MTTDDRASLEGERLLDSFIKLYDTGAQGCEMDHDTAQALALAIKGVVADLASCERALQRRTDERNNFAAQICEAARTPEPSARVEALTLIREAKTTLGPFAVRSAKKPLPANANTAIWKLARAIELLSSTSPPPSAAVLAEREAKLDDDGYLWKWVERALFDHSVTAMKAAKVIAHHPAAPWQNGRWDVDHKPYAAAFYRMFPKSARSISEEG